MLGPAMKAVSCRIQLLLLMATCALATGDDSCDYHDTLFDIGLSKVLGLPEFEEFPLPDIRRTFTKIFDFHVNLSNGKLGGLSNLMRGQTNFINATDAGITAHFEIKGGPLRVSYTGTVRSMPVDARVFVSIYIPRIEMMIYVNEPSPNNLSLEKLFFWPDPVTFRARQLDESSITFDILHWLAEGSIEEALNSKMGATVHEVVYQFLGMVELFARNGTKIGDIKKPLPDPVYIPAIFIPEPGGSTSYSVFPLGPWPDPSKWGVFDYCVKRITLASDLDPLILTDVSDFKWRDLTFQVTNLTMDGLAFLRRGGDNFARAEQCGIAARVALAFENINVRAYATTTSLRLRFDARIIAVDAVIEVTEINKTISIADYQLTFPVPLEYDIYVLTPVVGPVLDVWKGGLTRRHLTEDEKEVLEEMSKKYVEQAILEVAEFIKDPAPWMPWNNSVIEAYRRYSIEHRN